MLKIKSKIGKAPFKCPMCRAVFELPALPAAPLPIPVPAVDENQVAAVAMIVASPSVSSASSLPVNLFASSVLATVTTSSTTGLSSAKKVNPNEIKCEICDDGEDATSFCVQCSQYFCAGCQRGHKRLRTTTGHEFISVEKALKGKMKASIMHCEKHPHLEINTYCHTDKQAICAECILDSHKGHEVDRLADVVQGFKEEISTLIKKVSFLPLISSSFSR